MSSALRRNVSGARGLLLACPGILWVLVFLVLPLIFIAAISFYSRGPYGEIQPPLTLDNYKRFFGFGLFGFEPLYPLIIVRSLWLGLITTVCCVAGALPLAFFIAGLPPRWKTPALVLVIIPLWTNLLIRTYAWQILLGPGSFLSQAALALGLIPAGQALYPGTFAVVVGMACDFLPFLVLPLYASVEKLDWNLAEAAMDLGANRGRVFWHAILPQVRPGLVAGIILVFVPATGQFVVPDLLGGAKTVMVGNAIQQQFGPSRDWPFGSAVAVMVMLLVMAGLWTCARGAQRSSEEAFL